MALMWTIMRDTRPTQMDPSGHTRVGDWGPACLRAQQARHICFDVQLIFSYFPSQGYVLTEPYLLNEAITC